jgi:hypothetical protein
MRKLTRRKFLEAGLKGSIVVGGREAVSGLARPKVSSANSQKENLPASGFTQHERRVLGAAMDEVIPATDGMPAASDVGGVEYLDHLVRESSALKMTFQRGLRRLAEISRRRYKKDFLQLSHSERVAVLEEVEKQSPQAFFVNLRDFVYEVYYTRPRVWKLIGYEFYPTNQHGPRMKPFDDAVLAEVRRKPKFYREVE